MASAVNNRSAATVYTRLTPTSARESGERLGLEPEVELGPNTNTYWEKFKGAMSLLTLGVDFSAVLLKGHILINQSSQLYITF